MVNQPFVPGFCRTQRLASRTRARVLRPPDWLAYATSVLERGLPDADVSLHDLVADNRYEKDFTDLIRSASPDYVVLDSTTPSIHSDLHYASLVKEHSRARVVMVGPHVSALPEETLASADGCVDVACIGEYDHSVLDVVRHADDLDHVPGICFLKDGRPHRTGDRGFIDDLDALPFPAWHHLDLMKYFDGSKLHPYIDVIAGRGCPNRCIFCLWPQTMHGGRYRFRSPENVVDEIEYDMTLCPRVLKTGEFYFEDDTFTASAERAVAVCEEILRRNLKIRFSVNGRADNADPAMLKMMKKAGCRQIRVGFESGTQDILDSSGKGLSIDQSTSFVQCANRAGLAVHGCFVIGLPGETRATALRTIEHALALGLNTAQFSGAVPFPGTAFFDMCERNGWLLTRKWDKWLDGGEQRSVVTYPTIRQDEIDDYVDEGLRKFYLRPSYVMKFLLETKSIADLSRKVRGAANYMQYLRRQSRKKTT